MIAHHLPLATTRTPSSGFLPIIGYLLLPIVNRLPPRPRHRHGHPWLAGRIATGRPIPLRRSAGRPSWHGRHGVPASVPALVLPSLLPPGTCRRAGPRAKLRAAAAPGRAGVRHCSWSSRRRCCSAPSRGSRCCASAQRSTRCRHASALTGWSSSAVANRAACASVNWWSRRCS